MRPLQLCLVSLFVASTAVFGIAQDKAAKDEAAIMETTKSYVEAFNSGDAKALASHWTKGGSLVTPEGKKITGTNQLKKAFKTFFSKNKGIALEVTPLSVYVNELGEAIEEGVAMTVRADEEPVSSRYVASYVKQDGAWKIARLKEVYPIGASATHYEKLKPLEWMIGDWVDEDDSGRLESSFGRSQNGNFLVRSFALTSRGQVAFSGRQIIGWDAGAKKIRSWVFDSNGGFGEGTWTKKKGSWHVSTKVVLNTGEKASSVNIFTPIDDNSYYWQSIKRKVGSERLPDTPKVKVVRMQADAPQDTNRGK